MLSAENNLYFFLVLIAYRSSKVPTITKDSPVNISDSFIALIIAIKDF